VSEPEAPERDVPTPRPVRDSIWSLIPRRSLMSALILIVVLAAVIALRQRAGALARAFGEALLGTPPAGARSAPGQQPPRVRLAPVKAP
jgi:hypothetical protein